MKTSRRRRVTRQVQRTESHPAGKSCRASDKKVHGIERSTVLSIKIVPVQLAAISHTGCVRKNNEDNFFIDGDYMRSEEVNEGAHISAELKNPFHLFAVCDGMGGHEGGEYAAAVTVRELARLMVLLNPMAVRGRIDQLVRDANKAVRKDAERKGASFSGEGTTLALTYLMGDSMYVANVGDSRVYVLRLGELVQASVDHSELYRQVLTGKMTREEMRKNPASNQIDSYIGMAQERISRDFVAQVNVRLCKGDRCLICSDGLTDLLPHEEVTRLLGEGSVNEAAEQLVNAALEMGGKDNITVIVFEPTDTDLSEPDLDKLLRQQEQTQTTKSG